MSPSPHATAFGTAADAYDRYRLEPAPEAVDWVLRPGDRDVVDVGAGTGQLTRRLLARGLRVTAVEPDAEMRQALAGRVSGATVLAGVAEALPLPGESQDAVISHAAAHWFDPHRSTGEAARVLRPGGCLAALRTGVDPDVDWLNELWARLEPDPRDRRPGGRARISFATVTARIARSRGAWLFGRSGAPFEHQETHEVRFSRDLTPAELVGWAGTYSGLLVLSSDERQTRLDQVRQMIEARFAAGGAVSVSLRTTGWRAERR